MSNLYAIAGLTAAVAASLLLPFHFPFDGTIGVAAGAVIGWCARATVK